VLWTSLGVLSGRPGIWESSGDTVGTLEFSRMVGSAQACSGIMHRSIQECSGVLSENDVGILSYFIYDGGLGFGEPPERTPPNKKKLKTVTKYPPGPGGAFGDIPGDNQGNPKGTWGGPSRGPPGASPGATRGVSPRVILGIPRGSPGVTRSSIYPSIH
jgi:hypothetical protein